MSFSFDTKCEVCDNNVKNNCCKSAWLYGMVLFAQTITPSKLKITTENVVAINLLNQLASEICGINFSIGENINSYFAYLDDERLSTLYDNFYIYNNDSISYSISNVITESTCCKYAFIKGAFLSGGYVSNPQSSYHFEISTPYYTLAKNFEKFMRDLDFPAKTVVRNSNYVVYMKESAAIERLLCLIGANSSAFSFMDAKIYKEMNNYSNRINNTKIHNIEKTLNKSVEQVKAIEKISKTKGLDSLEEDLKYTAELRLQNPDKSLNELVILAGSKLSRSGLNRRLNKLTELARSIEE